MKHLLKLFFAFIIVSVNMMQNINAQITVSGSTGANGTYTSLTNASGAFLAINGAVQTGNTIVITITVNSTSEAGTNSLNAGAWTKLTIYPTITGLTISGSVTGPLINLNGANNIIIDGRVNATGSTIDLTISNTNSGAAASTIKFINTAANNIIKYCTVKGSSTNASGGVIFFSTATTGVGNSNNVIGRCNLTNAGTRPYNIIYSLGSTSYLNSSDTISNNNIYNFISASAVSSGINIGANSTAWNLTGNSFWETTSPFSAGAFSYYSIYITNASGNGFMITGNYIGGQSANCGGSAWTMNTAANIFYGIRLNVGTSTASSVQNNIIQNIATTSTSANPWYGIYVDAGNVNIGTVIGNIIGSISGTGNIFITSSASSPTIYGIIATSTGTVNIQNNNIGSINTDGGAAISYVFYGINTAGAAGIFTISGNHIGNATANSIAMGISGTTTVATTIYGINNSATGTISITGNKIQNCSSFGSGGSVFTGILNTGITTNLSINNDTLAANTLAGTGVYTGISNTAAVTTSINMNSNVISSGTLSAANASGTVIVLNNSNAGTSSTSSINTNSVSGISFTGVTGGTGTFTGINSSGTPLNCTINSNNFNNLSLKTTGTIYLIKNSYTAPANGNKTVQGNYITTAFARTIDGTNAFYCYYDASSSPNSVSHDISGNNFSNITINASNTGGFNGIFSNDASNPSLTVYNNTINNVSCGTGNVNGLYLNGFSGTSGLPNLVYGNTISNITSASVAIKGLYIDNQALFVNVYNNTITNISTTGAASLYGIYLAGATGINAYSNNINNLSSTGASTTIYGVYITGGTTNSVYKNQIYNLTSSGATAFAYGYYVNAGTTNNFYNNFISDIKTPASTNDRAVAGIFLYAGTTNNLYYNTIYLNTSSTGTTFGSSGIYCNPTSTNSLMNNIIINISTPGSTSGFTSALRFSSVVLTSYASASNNNNFYAGTPGTRNLIFYNGTAYQTIANFKALVTPRDAASHTDNTPFVNTVTTPYDLHISASTPTFVESNGALITTPFAIADDFDGQPRFGETGYSGTGTAPDIGADEGNFLYLTPSSVSVSISADPCITTNEINSGTTVTITATPTNGGTNPSYQWKLNGTIAGTNSPTYVFVPAVGDVVICMMTSNLSYVTGNPTISNSIALTVNSHQLTHYVSTTGMDNICNGTLSNPWLTIQYAINSSISGDIIMVDGGTYNIGTNQILINKALTLQAKAGISSKPKITTSYISFSYCAVRIAADNVVVDGFEIDGTSAFSGTFPNATSCYLIGDYTPSNIGFNNWTVKNCYLHHCREGIRLSKDNHVTIEGNEIAHTVKHCIDSYYSLSDGLKVTRNWLHSEHTDFGSSPAGISYLCDATAVNNVEISYNYVNSCSYFIDFESNGGTVPGNQILIMHNTIDWNLAPATLPITTNVGQGIGISWAGTGSWISLKFTIRDNIFSRLKYYAIVNQSGATGPLVGNLNINNNLFYQWYLRDANFPGGKYPNEWPATRGAVGWSNTDATPTFTNNDTLNPLYKATGTTAGEYYALSLGSPSYHTASDGTEIGAWQSHSQVMIWTGTIDTNWNTSGNWSTSIIPKDTNDAIIPNITNKPYINQDVTSPAVCNALTIYAGSRVTINPGKTLTVYGPLTNNNGITGIVIKSDSNGTGNLINNTQNVAGTVERFMIGNVTKKPIHYISSPIYNSDFSNIWSSGDYNIYWYDESFADADIDVGWTRISSGSLENCKGYAVVCKSNVKDNFTGILNSASTTATVTYTATTNPGSWVPKGIDPRGWNLIGNPFPCALIINGGNGFLNDNNTKLEPAYDALYFWDGPAGNLLRADYSSYNLIGGTGTSSSAGNTGPPGNFIPVGQGFYVRLKDNGFSTTYSTTLAFNASQKVASNSLQFFIPDPFESSRIWLSISSTDGLYNETLIGFLSAATKGFDQGYDAVKLKGNSNISLYSVLGNKDLVIQGLPVITDDIYVPVGLDVKNAGELTLYVNRKENFYGQKIYLEDLQESKEVDLTVDTFYKFNIGQGTFRNRFVLKFSPGSVGINPTNISDQNPIYIYTQDKDIHINNLPIGSVNSKVIIYNLLGKKMYDGALTKDKVQNNIHFNGASGYYFVTVITEKLSKTQKIFLNK